MVKRIFNIINVILTVIIYTFGGWSFEMMVDLMNYETTRAMVYEVQEEGRFIFDKANVIYDVGLLHYDLSYVKVPKSYDKTFIDLYYNLDDHRDVKVVHYGYASFIGVFITLAWTLYLLMIYTNMRRAFSPRNIARLINNDYGYK